MKDFQERKEEHDREVKRDQELLLEAIERKVRKKAALHPVSWLGKAALFVLIVNIVALIVFLLQKLL